MSRFCEILHSHKGGNMCFLKTTIPLPKIEVAQPNQRITSIDIMLSILDKWTAQILIS